MTTATTMTRSRVSNRRSTLTRWTVHAASKVDQGRQDARLVAERCADAAVAEELVDACHHRPAVAHRQAADNRSQCDAARLHLPLARCRRHVHRAAADRRCLVLCRRRHSMWPTRRRRFPTTTINSRQTTSSHHHRTNHRRQACLRQ